MSYSKGGKFYFFGFVFLLITGIFLLPKSALWAAPLTEQTIVEGINNERRNLELPALSSNTLLTRAAENKAAAILDRQEFTHNFSDKTFSTWVKETGYQYRVVGENLAIHFSDTSPLFNAWLASPTHKQNILHPQYREVGVAVMSGDWRGEATTLVVTVFATPSLPTAALSADSAEPFVPFTDSVNDAVTAPLLTSNLQEHYFQNISYRSALLPNQAFVTLPAQTSALKIKTATLQWYVSLAARIMTGYVTLMLAVVGAYFYASYITRLSTRLRQFQQEQARG